MSKQGEDYAIEVSHLTKMYGSLAAVDSLNLRIRSGRLFCLIGPNGAGKTTIIGCITGLIDPSGGSIRLLRETFTSNSAALKRRIGVMPEGLALFDQLYAHEFLAFNARMFGLDETTIRRRIDDLLDIMELSCDLRKPLAELSAGMRKKIAFAAAVIHKPEVLFLDEPFVSIDPAAAAMFKNWLRRFVARGGTVLMTSHVLETVERFCDEVAIIRNGSMVWTGEMAEAGDTGPLRFEGKSYSTLESLFLSIVGSQTAELEWL